MNPAGDAIVVWTQHDDVGIPNSSTFWANRRVAGSWTGPQVIVASSVNSPRVAIDPWGNATVLYTQSSRITSIRYEAATGWGTPAGVHDSLNPQYSPAIAMDGNGNALAVWSETTTSPSTSKVWGNRYSAGSGWQGATLLEPMHANANRCDVAMNPQGVGLAVWQAPDFYAFNIRFAPFDGTSWQIPVGAMALEMEVAPLANTIGGLLPLPAVELDSQGNAIVIWLVQDGGLAGSDTRTSLRAVRYDVVSGWDLATPIESFDSIIRNPSLAMSPTGSAFVLWEQRLDAAAERVIWSVRFDPQSGWGNPVSVGTGFQPKVAAASDGKAVAVWIQDDSLLASFYDPSTGWQASEEIEDNSGSAYAHEVAMTAGGKAVVVWRQYLGNQMGATWANQRE